MLQTYKTTLTEKVPFTHDVFHLKFVLDEPKELCFIPGQYMIMRVPPDSLPRLYSIASAPDQKNSFELIMKIEPFGKASTYVQNSQVGDQFVFQGPAGVFRLKDTPNGKIFLATSCGIAPMRSMLLSIIENREVPHYYLFWGLPTYKDVYLFDEIKNLKSQIKNFDFRICLSREQNLGIVPEEDRQYFALGHVDDCIEEAIHNSQFVMDNSEFYLCGSRHVTESLKIYLLTQKQVSPSQVVFEKF